MMTLQLREGGMKAADQGVVLIPWGAIRQWLFFFDAFFVDIMLLYVYHAYITGL